MIKKLVLAAAVAAVAVSFAPTASFAKMHKMKPCAMGTMASGKANSMGWSPVSMCGMDGKMYPMIMMCYMGSQLCPPSM
jgi:hypothetical protein